MKSDVSGSSDVMSLMLANTDVFNEDDIIDEVLDLLVAGTQTTQYISQTILAHYITDPESLSRTRAEFKKVCEDNGETRETLSENVTFDLCSDLEYLGNVILEALRLYPVATGTSPYWFENGAKLGNLYMQPKETFFINVYGLHRNGNYW